MSVKPECVKEILDALIGTTTPYGSTERDAEAQSNTQSFGEVCKWVFGRLCEANEHYNANAYSEQKTARMVLNAAGDLALIFDVEEGRCDWLKVVK